MDDSHGIAAYGRTGRGTEEHCGARVDIFVGTFGKAFGVNGGFVAGSAELVEAVRQKADTYIYTNPLGAGGRGGRGQGHRGRGQPPKDARGSRICRRARRSSGAGSRRSASSRFPGRTRWCRWSSATPAACDRWSRGLFDRGILAVGLTFPVVPNGDETIRFQINAAHTECDIDEVLGVLKELKAVKARR